MIEAGLGCESPDAVARPERGSASHRRGLELRAKPIHLDAQRMPNNAAWGACSGRVERACMRPFGGPQIDICGYNRSFTRSRAH